MSAAAEPRLIRGVALAVHDFKSPLAGILAHAQWLATRDDLPEEAREAVRDIVEGARSLDRRILDLLDVCRSEDGALVPRVRQVDLSHLIREAAAALGRRAARQEQQIVVDVSLADRPVHADPELLRRVMENLLDNALKYSPWRAVIQVEARRLGDELEVAVSDPGEGIPAESRKAIFESYVRLDRGALQNVGSSRGLGLAFCRAAIEAHGGRIWVEENSPKGSTFLLRLPAGTGAPRGA